MIIKIADAILAINPNAVYNYYNEDADTIEWLDNTTPISKEDILAKQSELQAIENAKPSIEELKASAKTKLMNGEALTEDEANVMVGL